MEPLLLEADENTARAKAKEFQEILKKEVKVLS
jgi:hypothetical protein